MNIIKETDVYGIPSGNIARRFKEPTVVHGTIKKVGRVYFYVQFDISPELVKFNLKTRESFCDDCNSHYEVYPTEAAARAVLSSRKMLAAIRRNITANAATSKLPTPLVAEFYEKLTGDKSMSEYKLEPDAKAYRAVASRIFLCHRYSTEDNREITSVIMANSIEEARTTAAEFFGDGMLSVHPLKSTDANNVFAEG